ncbi:MAG TPA: S1/P1 Nuclease [Caulobacteraceae bacterium]|nr:S1/P1 Nuclease [Caulobacteraceae bacterium]
MRGGFMAALASALALLVCGPALAWGSTGHRWIGRAAILALPPQLPAFLRSPAMVQALGELSREPDRSRDAGLAHDSDRDPGHFVDGDDDGRIAGGPLLGALPPTREAYETALRARGTTSWKMGYLPYSIVEDWQQLAKDFAYWRADDAGARLSPDAAHRAWLAADRALREGLIRLDLGALSHYVGDGSMPLHASIHYNGWGPFPNPQGYTQEKVHVAWEGAYVRAWIPLAAVVKRMRPFQDCGCPIEQRVGAYLGADLAAVVPFYQLEKAGAFQGGEARGRAFTAARLAAGADELRDEIVLAWRASAHGRIGYQPQIDVADVEAGRIDPYGSLHGAD